MANFEALETQAATKLALPCGKRAEHGIFLMPISVVQEWYQRSDVPSLFRGEYVRGDAELHLTVAKNYSYNLLLVRLSLPLGRAEDAHKLYFHRGKEPKLISTVKRERFGIVKISCQKPNEEDIEAFSKFIDQADDYNVIVPLSEYRTREGFSFSRIGNGLVLPSETATQQNPQ